MGSIFKRGSVGDRRGGRVPRRHLAVAAALAGGVGASRAPGAVWTAAGSGTWTTGTNWDTGAPNGVDAVADFSQVDLTADATVGLGTAQTVGTLDFGDTNPTTAGGWLLSDATQQTLTLSTSAGDATIYVGALGTGKAATIASAVKVAAGQVVDKTGAGTLIFTNTTNASATVFAGILDIQAGTFQVASTSALPNFDPTTIRLDGGTMRFSTGTNTGRVFTLAANGGTIDFAAASAFSGTGPMLFTGTGARTLTVNSEAGASSIASLIGDAAVGSPTSITKVGAGSLSLTSASNSFTGGITVSAGNLTTTTLGGGNVSVAAGSTLTLSRTTSQSLAGSFTGGGNFVQTGGTGTVTLANASYTGSTTVQNGTFVVGPSSSTSNYVLGTAGSYFTFGILSLSADFTAPVGTTGGGVTFAGSGAGGGFVNPTAGTRVVNLGGSGATVTLNSGGFYAGSTGANGSTTDARFKFGDVNGAALGTVDFQNAIALNGRTFKTVTDGAAQYAAILSGNISGTGDATNGAIIKFGAGNLELTGSNTYTGATTIGGNNAIVLGSANAFSPNTNLVLSGGAAGTNAGVLGLGAYGNLAATLGTAAGNVGFASGASGGFAAFGGNRQVTLNGGVTLAWASTASFVPNGQNLILSLPSADGTVTLNNPVDLNGALRTVYVNRGTGTSVDAVLPGNISDSLATNGGLLKAGPGVLVLSGSNTYGGTTNVSSGTVRVNNPAGSGTGSGPVVVAATATLGGNGTIAGTVTVNGTITAGPDGATPQTLTTGAQTWVAGGRYVAKVSGDGTANDQLVMAGLTVPATGAFAVQLNGLGTSPTTVTAAGLVLAVDNSGSAANDGVFQNAINSMNLTLATTNVTTTSGSAPQLTEVDVGNTQELLVYDATAAAPEPASLLLAGIAAAPLALGRRRRVVAG